MSVKETYSDVKDIIKCIHCSQKSQIIKYEASFVF